MEFFNPKKRKTLKVKSKSPLKPIKPGTKPIHKRPTKTSTLTEAQKRRLRRGRPHKLKSGLSL